MVSRFLIAGSMLVAVFATGLSNRAEAAIVTAVSSAPTSTDAPAVPGPGRRSEPVQQALDSNSGSSSSFAGSESFQVRISTSNSGLFLPNVGLDLDGILVVQLVLREFRNTFNTALDGPLEPPRSEQIRLSGVVV